MQRQTRMWRTLIALAIAMSGTTGLLAWMDPSEPSPELHSRILLQQAADLIPVGTSPSAHPNLSRIDLLRGENPSDMLLSASYNKSPAHVIVDAAGEIHRGSIGFTSGDASLLVRVDLATTEPTLSPGQWLAVRALTTRLQTGGRLVDLHLDADFAASYGLSPSEPLHLDPL